MIFTYHVFKSGNELDLILFIYQYIQYQELKKNFEGELANLNILVFLSRVCNLAYFFISTYIVCRHLYFSQL